MRLFRKNLFFCLLFTFGLLATVELGMRAFGYAITLKADKKNNPSVDDLAKIRIIALGESTTAEYSTNGQYRSWPQLLEKKLRDSGINARVYNLGIGGTITPLILDSLEGNLEKFTPHIVISMMGINDYPGLRFEQVNSWVVWLKKFRLYKLFIWIRQASIAATSCHTEVFIDYGASDIYFKKYQSQFRKRTPAEIETLLRYEGADNKVIASIFTRAAEKLRGDFSTNDLSREAFQYAYRAFQLSPREQRTIFQISQLMQYKKIGLDPATQKEILDRILECGPNLSDELFGAISWAISKHKDSPGLRGRSIEFWDSDLESTTTYHYRLMAKILIQKKISLIAMQYPTLSVEFLKARFKSVSGEISPEFQDVVFVSNEKNFLYELTRRRYDELFLDRFRGSWGHSTQLGYEMIAESVFPSVLDVLKMKNLIPNGYK